MLILLSAALFGFGLLLFGLGLAAWLIGLAIQIAIWVFQLVLLIVWAGITFYSWMQRRTFVRTELIKLEVSTSRNVDRIGRAPHLRGNIRTKHGSRRVPYLTLVD
jgi:hypothetical protein